jgi:CubicO group peptidase (beta-lactamase class C family)
LTPAHRFRIASISKPITSVMQFRLIEQDRVKLDDLVFGPRGVLGAEYGKPPYRPHIADIRIVPTARWCMTRPELARTEPHTI